MQPNQNMAGAAPVVGDQAASGQNIMAVGVSEKKKGKGMIIGLVLLALIAAGGIGFGVWAMMDGKTGREQLNSQIQSLQRQNSELLEEINSTSNATTNDPSAGTVVNTADYIYVGEWGLKIKIPEGLSSVSYRFGTRDGYTSVVVWGVDCSDGGCQYFPEYADVEKNTFGMGSIARYPKGTVFDVGSAPTLVFSDEEYDYYQYHPQAPYTLENPSDEATWEIRSTDIIGEMLSKPENYSKI